MTESKPGPWGWMGPRPVHVRQVLYHRAASQLSPACLKANPRYHCIYKLFKCVSRGSGCGNAATVLMLPVKAHNSTQSNSKSVSSWWFIHFPAVGCFVSLNQDLRSVYCESCSLSCPVVGLVCLCFLS